MRKVLGPIYRDREYGEHLIGCCFPEGGMGRGEFLSRFISSGDCVLDVRCSSLGEAYPSGGSSSLYVRLFSADGDSGCFVRTDAHSLPFACDTFDVVLCCRTLEYLRRPEVVYLELLRVSRGMVVCSVPSLARNGDGDYLWEFSQGDCFRLSFGLGVVVKLAFVQDDRYIIWCTRKVDVGKRRTVSSR